MNKNKLTEHEIGLLFKTLEDKRLFFERNPLNRQLAIEYSNLISKLFLILNQKSGNK